MPTAIEIDTDGTMRRLATLVEGATGPKYGFMILVFPFGGEVRSAHYISNARREDRIKALREKADVLERKSDLPPGEQQ